MICLWCEGEYKGRETGGTEQRFCSTACRRCFDTAARKWVREAIDLGLMTSAQLRNGPTAARALVSESLTGIPAQDSGKSQTAPSGQISTPQRVTVIPRQRLSIAGMVANARQARNI